LAPKTGGMNVSEDLLGFTNGYKAGVEFYFDKAE